MKSVALIKIFIKRNNLSASTFGFSLAAALYGYLYLSILLLFLSGALIKNKSIDIFQSDFIFLSILTSIFVISVASSYWRNASHELIALTAAYTLSLYIFFVVKANYENIHQAIGVLTICFFISSLDLLIVAFNAGSFYNLGMIENSITKALIVPNDYVLFAIAMPLFSFSLKYFPFNRKWSLPFSYLLGLLTAAGLNSRLCVLLIIISLVFEYQSFKKIIENRIFAFLVLIVILIVTLTPEFLHKLQSLPTSRIPLWDAAIHQTKLNPWLGMGLDSFRSFYADHIENTIYSELIVVDRRSTPWPHNLFLEISASFGLIVSALIILGTLIILSNTDKLRNPLNRAVRTAFFLFLIASLFELTYLRLYPVILIIFLTSLEVTDPGFQKYETKF